MTPQRTLRPSFSLHGVAALLTFLTSSALSGCVASIAPVVPASAGLEVPELVGTWLAKDGDRATVSVMNDTAYAIRYVDSDGTRTRYFGRAGRLGGRLVLDVWSAPGQNAKPPGSGGYPGTLIPGHLLVVLEMEHGPAGAAGRARAVRLAVLRRDSLAAALRTGALRVPFLDLGEGPILTGPTDSLRGALEPYLDRPGVLTEPERWHHVSALAGPVEPPCFEAAPWPAADSLFRRDPRWVGSDDAYSVDLGSGRTLWLFGDTWIDPTGRGRRESGRMIRNSVGIQTGPDPSSAPMAFRWQRGADGAPASFFGENGGDWFWPGDGVRLGDRLVLFLMRVRHAAGGLGFRVHGWDALLVENPDADPSKWRMRRLDTPRNDLGVAVGSAGVLTYADTLYAFGSQETIPTHPMYLVRWPMDDVRSGDLTGMEWWGGPDTGWVSDASSAARWPVFLNGQTELTVHHDATSGEFLAVQTVGFGAADIALRAAPAPEGPWSPARIIFRPPEYRTPGVMIYAAKAHPELTGADVVLTYATNLFDGLAQVADLRIYFPRFVRLNHCR